jgi:hypothetical protein
MSPCRVKIRNGIIVTVLIEVNAAPNSNPVPIDKSTQGGIVFTSGGSIKPAAAQIIVTGV